MYIGRCVLLYHFVFNFKNVYFTIHHCTIDHISNNLHFFFFNEKKYRNRYTTSVTKDQLISVIRGLSTPQHYMKSISSITESPIVRSIFIVSTH